VETASEDLQSIDSKMILRKMMTISKLDDEDAVNEFTSLKNKCVLFFTASWCEPCTKLKPAFDKLAQQYAGESSIGFATVDIDQYTDATEDYCLTAVPTFIFYDGDRPVETFTGSNVTRVEELIQQLAKRRH
jgi:thioredoxin 1